MVIWHRYRLHFVEANLSPGSFVGAPKKHLPNIKTNIVKNFNCTLRLLPVECWNIIIITYYNFITYINNKYGYVLVNFLGT